MNSVMRIFSIFLLSAFVICAFAAGTNRVFAGAETGVDVGQKAAPFKLLTVEGKELELGSFAKDKVTSSSLYAGNGSFLPESFQYGLDIDINEKTLIINIRVY